MIATTSTLRLMAVVPVGILMFATGAQAASFTLIDGEGFEGPAYNPGNLEGQFASTFEGFGSAAWVQSPLGGTSSAEVQSTVVASGTQAVEVNRAANSDDRWAVPVTGAPAEPIICIEWDMYVESAGTAQPFGPLFGIEAYDDDATSILRIGTLGVDASTGDVVVTDRDNGLVETGSTVNFDEWNSFRMVLDFSTDTYVSFVNNVLVSSIDFESAGADQFTDADIAAIAAGIDAASQAATGTAYFDNYLVFETDDFSKTVPEPTALAITLLAVVASSSRRMI